MFQSILVPLDGSKVAERAIHVAAQLARSSNGSVTLLQVVNPATEFWQAEVFSTSRNVEKVIEVDLTDAEHYLAEKSISPDLRDISTKTMVLVGNPATTILSVASSVHADVIVLCDQGHHGYIRMRHQTLGTVAEKVVNNASTPVLLLREEESAPPSSHVNDTRPFSILVPMDGSVHAKAALEPAAYLVAALAAPERGAIHLVRVANLPSAVNTEEWERLTHRARRYLESTAEQIQEGLVAPAIARLKLPVTWSVALDTDVAEAIVKVAENGAGSAGADTFDGCHVIAIATHGSDILEHRAGGSVTARVLHLTRLPLLIIRSHSAMVK